MAVKALSVGSEMSVEREGFQEKGGLRTPSRVDPFQIRIEGS